MTAIEVYLELGGRDGHLAHLPDLPGCCLRGRTRERLLAAVPQVATFHAAWLRSHGAAVDLPENPEFAVAEECHVGEGPAGSEARAWFSWDGRSLPEAEFLRWLKLIAAAHGDILERVMDAPGELLEWRSGPRRRSILQLLERTADGEGWLLSRLKDDPGTLVMPAESGHPGHHDHPPAADGARDGREGGPPEGIPKGRRGRAIFERLKLTRTKVMAILYFFFEHDRDRRFQHGRETWSLRKVLRRYLEAEMESLRAVDEVVSRYWRKCNEGILLSADGTPALADPGGLLVAP